MRKQSTTPASTPTPPHYCPNCGTPLAPGARYCHECGTDIVSAVASAASVAPAKKKGISTRWKIVGGILVLLVVFGLARSGSNTPTQQRAMTANTATARVPTSTPDATSQVAAQTKVARGGAAAAASATSVSLPATAMPTPTPTATPHPTSTPLPTPTPPPAPIGTTLDAPAPIGTTLTADGLAVTVESAYFDYGFANAIPRGGYKVLIMQVTIRNDGDRNERYDAASFSGIDANTDVGYDPVTLEDVGVLLRDGDLEPGEFVSGTVLIEVQETATNVIVKFDPNMFTTDDLYWS
jgi:hypothetical protein